MRRRIDRIARAKAKIAGAKAHPTNPLYYYPKQSQSKQNRQPVIDTGHALTSTAKREGVFGGFSFSLYIVLPFHKNNLRGYNKCDML